MEWGLKSEYRKMNKVFYAETYHPIQAGSIDGTDTTPHDNAVCRALLCSSASLYDPLGDPKLIGDPCCTLFVARLSHFTSEDSLRNAMSKYGRIKNLRIVRDIVTGASRGYAFVVYETEREMRRAYKDAHHSLIDDSEILVDYSRQQLMPGWIPRRLGGGLGGRKESGQLRFGGRERPFQAPLKPPPLDELKRLGIPPPPPEGRYMSRFQVPSPPRRKRSSMDREESSRRCGSLEREDIYSRRSAMDREEHSRKRHSVEREEHRYREESNHRSRKRISQERNDHCHRGSFDDRENEHGRHHHRSSYKDRENDHDRRNTLDRERHSRERSRDTERHSSRNSSRDQEESSHKHRSYSRSDKRERRKPPSQDSAND